MASATVATVDDGGDLDAAGFFTVSVSAPGKVILFGEHSVVYSKPALAAALGLRTHLTLSENLTGKFSLNLTSVKLEHQYDVEDISRELLSAPFVTRTIDRPDLVDHDSLLMLIENYIRSRGGSAPLQTAQYQALVAVFYLLVAIVRTSEAEMSSFSLTVKSDLPISAGLGSSASFLVVVSAALIEYVRYRNRRLSVEDLRGGGRPRRPGFDRHDLDLVSRWAFNAERIIHGNPSGLDNTICSYGMMVEFKKMSPIVPVDLRKRLKVVLVDSKIPKNTKTQVVKVYNLKETYPGVVDSILNAMEEIAKDALDKIRRLDETTEGGAIAELHGNLDDLVDMNQNLLRALQVSHASIDEICDVLRENGLRGKLTGAGGGGYAFAIVPPGFGDAALDSVVRELTGRGYDVKVTELGGSGLIYTNK